MGVVLILIRELKKDEIKSALELAWSVFQQFEAPDYSEEGIKEFYRSIHDPLFVDSLRVYGVFEESKLVGTLATCNDGNHIALFFVSEFYQHQGIGKALYLHACHDNASGKMTVNSSPFAVPIYHHLGFTALKPEQVTNGLRYTPMECKLKQI